MKYIHTLLVILFISTITVAQTTDNQNRNEQRKEKMENRIESQKVAFITQKLDLTPGEAQQFWPIYNEYQSKMKEMRQKNRIKMNLDDIEDAEANEILNSLLAREQEELNLKSQYLNKLKTVVPAKKVAQLYIIEKQFREEILAKIKSKIGQKKRKARRNNNGF